MMKKLLAFALSATMVLCSASAVFAAPNATGGAVAAPNATGGAVAGGEIEGIVADDVYNAVLPVNGEAVTDFTYIVDPQGLIRATDAKAYNGADFEEGATVYFNNSEGDVKAYSDESNKQTITNKSSKPLKVTVKAKATVGTSGDDASLGADGTFAGTEKEVYLAIMDTVNTTGSAITAAYVPTTVTMGAAPAGAYEYKYADGAYSYSLVANADNDFTFAEYSFWITGKANPAADWKATTTVPTIDIVWDVELAPNGTPTAGLETPAQNQNKAPSIATTNYTLTAGTPINITVDFGKGDLKATSVDSVKWGTVELKTMPEYISWNSENKTITLTAACVGKLIEKGGDVVVTFNDTAATAVPLTFTK